MHRRPVSTTPPPKLFRSDNNRGDDDDENDDDNIAKAPNGDNGEDVVDDGKEALQRLLSPQGALAAELIEAIVRQVTSAERSRDLASMSRRRYAATQCVSVLLAILIAGVVVLVTLTQNEALSELLLRALNATLHSSSADDSKVDG